MWPVLFELDLPLVGEVVVRSYGAALVLGVMAFLLVVRVRARRLGVDTDHVLWAAIWIIPATMILAKVLPLLAQPELLRAELDLLTRLPWPGRLSRVLLWPLTPGGNLYVIVPILAALGALYSRLYGLRPLRTLDSMAVGTAAAIPFIRTGCFAAGCCFGKPTALPWAVVFPPQPGSGTTLAPADVALHPTQLYELALGIGLLAWGIHRSRDTTGRPGLLFAEILGGYALGRFLIEFLRDDRRAFVIPESLSAAQAVCLGLLAGAIWLRLRLARAATPPSVPPPGPSPRRG